MRHDEDIDSAPRGSRPLPLEEWGDGNSPIYVDQEDGVVESTNTMRRMGLLVALVAGLAILAVDVLLR